MSIYHLKKTLIGTFQKNELLLEGRKEIKERGKEKKVGNPSTLGCKKRKLN